jgi:polysaccharide pyruvyl transferase WcaK-like protein
MTRVGLSHWYSEANLGDLAIVTAQIDLLEQRETDPLVVGIDDGMGFPSELAPYPKISSPWGSPGTVGAVRWMAGLVSAGCTLVAPRSAILVPRKYREFARYVAELDVLMPKGGGYLYARRGLRAFLFTLRICWPLLLARRLGVRRVLWGHSVGPAESRIGARVLRAALIGAEITVRDEQSVRLLERWGIPAARKPDLAFLWRGKKATKERRAAKSGDGSCRVGVTALVVGRGREQASYESTIARAVRAVVSMAEREGLNTQVALLPQVIGPTEVEDDRPVLERIRRQVPVECFFEELSHSDVRIALGTFSRLDFLIATRLHSAILASCAGVPFVVVEYIGGKADGAVRDLGLPPWVRTAQISNLPAAAQRGWDTRFELAAKMDQAFSKVIGEIETLNLN